MENVTMVPLKHPIVFELEGFYVPPGYSPLFFFLTLLNFLVVLLVNGAVAAIIVIDKSLHRPMFMMVCHLVACDLLGASAVMPRLMVHFLTGQKRIAYIPALAQAFSVHVYGAAMQTVLAAMAYDRYIAVCEPLRYHSIMTSARLHSCCALAWIVALVLIAVLFGLHMGVQLCGNVIRHVYCSNRSILSLSCKPTPSNNIYGLSMTWTLSTSIFVIIAFSYIKILHASFKHGKTDHGVRAKAFQTCASHLVVYVLYQIGTVVMIMSQRFASASPNLKKFFSILFFVVPPTANPIIYGLVSKELRSSIIKHLTIQAKPKK